MGDPGISGSHTGFSLVSGHTIYAAEIAVIQQTYPQVPEPSSIFVLDNGHDNK